MGLYVSLNIAVKEDKARECYLGSSVKAPHGRWQKNKDLNWYHKEKQSAASVDRDEVANLKRLEAEAMQQALGGVSVDPELNMVKEKILFKG